MTFTATVSSVSGPVVPNGETVTFKDGATVIGTGGLSSGAATFTTSTLSVARHSITASYGGDIEFIASNSFPLPRPWHGNHDDNCFLVGEPVGVRSVGDVHRKRQIEAVNANGETVTFKDGASTIGTATLSSGSAAFSTSALSVAGHSITVVYGGDSNFGGSTSTILKQSVNQDATTTTVASLANPSTFGQQVTFTSTVTANGPGAGSPTGTVTFVDGVTTLGTGMLTLIGGVAKTSFTTSAFELPAGTGQSITAVYGGDTNFATSTSTAVSQSVSQEPSTTSVGSSANPAVYGQTVTLTATVSGTGAGGTPTGTVTFLDGGSALGTGVLSNGSATFQTSTLALGSNSITVSYPGDNNFPGSTSATLLQAVNQDASTTTLTSSANPSVYGQSVTFTAVVSPAGQGGGTPTGTVIFQDQTTGATLGTVTLTGGEADLATTGLSIGGQNITATYSGDTNFFGGASGVLVQAVNQDASSAGLSISTTTAGQTLYITASISPAGLGGGTPTGTVTLKINNTSYGTLTLTNGVATFMVTGGLVAGNYTFYLSYSGDGDFFSSSNSLTAAFSGGRG